MHNKVKKLFGLFKKLTNRILCYAANLWRYNSLVHTILSSAHCSWSRQVFAVFIISVWSHSHVCSLSLKSVSPHSILFLPFRFSFYYYGFSVSPNAGLYWVVGGVGEVGWSRLILLFSVFISHEKVFICLNDFFYIWYFNIWPK